MESEVMKFICANQGAVDTDYLVFNLGLGSSVNVSKIICNREMFAACCPSGQPTVVARTALRLCRDKDCPGSCRGLHLCKHFLFSGTCQFGRSRGRCNFSHELDSAHNERILREHELENLNRTELCTLLLQNDFWLLPPICYDYNNGDGEFGRCQDGDGCKRVHICEKYLNHDCSCSRSHDFNAPQPSKTLQDRGVPNDLIPSLKPVYANIQALKFSNKSANRDNKGNYQQRGGYRGNRGNQGNRQVQQRTHSISDIVAAFSALDSDYGSNKGNRGDRGNHQQLQQVCSTNNNEDASSAGGRIRRERPVRDKTEICMYFIKGHCKNEDRCFKAHDKMPYRWEVRVDGQWNTMPDNEAIEKDYCDPENTHSDSSSPPVHFDTMTCGPNKVRRLSTINSLLQPTFILTTEWVWYWEDELGKWNLYASADGGHKPADMDSSKLEQKFLDNDKDVVEFTAGSQSYSLSFKDMIQTNKQYSTKRLVKRLPLFVSATDVKTRRVRRPLGQPNLAATPAHWDKAQIPQTGYKRVSLQRSSDEFKEIEALFCKTMRGFDIVKIERIQNKALWEVFQWQKTQMKNNNGGSNVTEKKLFHGTDSKFVDTICHANFDWRICGTHGTAYGKGSYFARDAKYSHNYTSDSDVKSMFISRLLVGDYTKGSPDYRRPPSKDSGDINFFDSCVDDVINPSIYVVFEKHQIYPEHLLQYKTTHPFVGLYGAASAPALRPAPRPAPVPVPRPAPQPSVSSYQSSASSYQPSASGYRASETTYQSGTSIYKSSTSHQYQSPASSSPDLSAKKTSDSCVIA